MNFEDLNYVNKFSNFCRCYIIELPWKTKYINYTIGTYGLKNIKSITG